MKGPRFLSEARRELFDASTYYESQAPGLGDQFLDEIDRAVALIRAHPRASPVLQVDLRRKVLRKFPYSLLYSIEDELLLIVAVMHHRRRPGYWVGRPLR